MQYNIIQCIQQFHQTKNLLDVYILQNKRIKTTCTLYSVLCTLKDTLAQSYLLKMNPTFVPLSACTASSACWASIENHRELLFATTLFLFLGCDAYTTGKSNLGRRPHDYKEKGQFLLLTKYTKIFFHHIVVKRIGVEMFGVFPFDRRR